MLHMHCQGDKKHALITVKRYKKKPQERSFLQNYIHSSKILALSFYNLSHLCTGKYRRNALSAKFLPTTMQFTLFLLAVIAIISWAAGVPNDQPRRHSLISRQSNKARFDSTLQDARNKAMEDNETGRGRGRTLSSAPCSALCSRCQSGAVTKVVAEVVLCGTGALATEVVCVGGATNLATNLAITNTQPARLWLWAF